MLTVRLAHLFAQAVGLDPDADMLAEGCRAAAERAVAQAYEATRKDARFGCAYGEVLLDNGKFSQAGEAFGAVLH